MEPIKITDKLTLRQEALRMAIYSTDSLLVNGNLKDILLKRAKDIADYIQGDSDLPERDNSMEKYLQELKDSVLNFRSNPWISADDEMKPAKGVEVVCALRYGSKIEQALMVYDHESKKWYDGDDDGNTDHVVAWMFIPEYRPKL